MNSQWNVDQATHIYDLVRHAGLCYIHRCIEMYC